MNQSVQIIYEERQVLWAKIRGYPWWPAYVSTVHSAQHPNDYEYTVIFFGDNTNSRLGPSKLRRFPDGYADCFLKAKTNKKLRQSIQKAQQRLSENHENISIYQNIRNQILNKKRKGTVSQSRLSSSQKLQALQAPDLIKHKTQQPPRNSRAKKTRQDNEIFQEQQSQNRQNSHNGAEINSNSNNKLQANNAKKRTSQKLNQPSNRRQNLSRANQLDSNSFIQKKQNSPEKRTRKISRLAKQAQKSSQQEQSQKQIEPQKYKLRRSRKAIYKQQYEVRKVQKSESQQQEQSMSNQKVKIKKKQPIANVQKRGRPKGKKGRPPKLQQQIKKVMKQQQQQNLEQSQSYSENLGQNNKDGSSKIKFMDFNILNNEKKLLNQIGTLSEVEEEKIKNSLDNRNQLIRVLLSIPINVGNVKQILDLGVTLPLQDGPITKRVHCLLNILKSALLHKFFPDNNKHRRKYQKMSKQIRKLMQMDEEDNQNNDENSENQNNSKINNSKRHQNNESKFLSQQNNQKQTNNFNTIPSIQNKNLKLSQIKQKAISKLQKMIEKAGLKQGVKFYAKRIQNTFQLNQKIQMRTYKTIAYKRMRQLKTKLIQLGNNFTHSLQIKKFIEETIHTYEKQNLNQLIQEEAD